MKKTLTLLAAALLLCSAAFAAERTETKPAAETVSIFVLDGEGNLQLTEGAVADIDACKTDGARFTEPVFLIDDDGTVKLTDAATTVDGDIEVRKCFSGPCNGGSCETAGGTVLNCPTSGGPSCNSSQECSCSCAGGTARNVCT